MKTDDRSSTAAEAQWARYRRDGAICLRGVFRDWVDVLNAGIERNMAEPGPDACFNRGETADELFFTDYCNWQRIPEFEAFVTESPAAEIAGRCMNSRTSRLFIEQVIVKQGGVALATPWHHDMPYLNVAGEQTASIWVALDVADRHVAPSFVIGSHRWGKLFRPRAFQDGATYDDTFDPVPDVSDTDRYPRAAWDVEPGDALVFDFRTLHGTTSQRVGHRRAGFSTRWVGDDIEQGGMSYTIPLPWDTLPAGSALPADACPILWTDPQR